LFAPSDAATTFWQYLVSPHAHGPFHRHWPHRATLLGYWPSGGSTSSLLYPQAVVHHPSSIPTPSRKALCCICRHLCICRQFLAPARGPGCRRPNRLVWSKPAPLSWCWQLKMKGKMMRGVGGCIDDGVGAPLHPRTRRCRVNDGRALSLMEGDVWAKSHGTCMSGHGWACRIGRCGNSTWP
jgi:hypothetical protein